MNGDAEIFIARQPILNANQEIVAYELLFRSGETAGVNVTDDLYATSRVMVNTLNNIGINKILGDKLGFININEDMLKLELYRNLPSDRFVLEILEDTQVNEFLVEKMESAKEEGYVFALDDFVFEEKVINQFRPLFSKINYLKVDLSLNKTDEVMRKLQIFKNYHNIKMLAEKVENMEEFEFYKRLGFNYFQGYFFSKPFILKSRNIDPMKTVLLSMISLIQQDPDITKIEQQFKLYPDLTINLLKFINSASVYVRNRITSIRQAISLIGYKKLLNWLLLLAYAKPHQPNRKNPLLNVASQRGKAMEILLKMTGKSVSGAEQDEAFLVGLLSLMDVLFLVPMEEILTELNMNDDIKEAIIQKKGELGRLLNILIMNENDYLDKELPMMLVDENLTQNNLNDALLQSYIWVEEMTSSID